MSTVLELGCGFLRLVGLLSNEIEKRGSCPSLSFIYSVADCVQTPTEEETELAEQFNIEELFLNGLITHLPSGIVS